LELTHLSCHDLTAKNSNISAFAARAGATKVVAVDANPTAVENATLNCKRFGIVSATAFVSEGFAAVEGRFDVIIFNAPYHGCKPNDLLERGCADEDYNGLKGFFRDVKSYLKPNGLIGVGFSESGDIELFKKLVADHGFTVNRTLIEWRDGYNCMIFELAESAR
jgi:release factor glutamine methyltransferase